jgi:hypothetical protein
MMNMIIRRSVVGGLAAAVLAVPAAASAAPVAVAHDAAATHRTAVAARAKLAVLRRHKTSRDVLRLPHARKSVRARLASADSRLLYSGQGSQIFLAPIDSRLCLYDIVPGPDGYSASTCLPLSKALDPLHPLTYMAFRPGSVKVAALMADGSRSAVARTDDDETRSIGIANNVLATELTAPATIQWVTPAGLTASLRRLAPGMLGKPQS